MRLCNINAHRGVYEYQSLPFGVKSALGIFQAILDDMLAGLPFATVYLDDVVMSRSPDDYRRHLHAVFYRINEMWVSCVPREFSFFQPRIKSLGFIVDKDGRRPDPQKITAVADMLAPTNITTLRYFLGLVNYYQPFIPNMRSIRQPLDELLKNNEWILSARCQQAFESIKGILNSDLLLTHSL
jgi:hypothetical protein